MRRPSYTCFIASLTFLLLMLVIDSAIGRTWFVAADGSGDAPTVVAAIDSTVAGDVILLGPGTFAVGDIDIDATLKAGTTLTSQFGPLQTLLIPGGGVLQPGVLGTRDNCIVSGVSIVGGQETALFNNGANVEVFNNIFHGRLTVFGATRVHNNLVDYSYKGILIGTTDPVQINNNIVLGNIATSQPGCFLNVFITCNLVQAGPICVALWGGNINADPLFCGAPSNYYLRADSPCAPGHNYDGFQCDLIGPLPVGCGVVKVQAATWGAVKAMYRD